MANIPFKIAVIPLDDRPCNYEYLSDLGKIGSIEVILPPKDLIRSLSATFDHDALNHWLRAMLPQVNAAVISIDGYVYGGLIRSRKMEIIFEEAKNRLSSLVALQSEFPEISFFYSNVLFRLSITINATQSEATWRGVFRYSVLKGKVDLTSVEAAELIQLESELPAGVLEEYLAVRRRNHELNLEALALLPRAGFILFGQEDCGPVGVHLVEKLKLAKESPKENCLILTGADELNAQLVLLAFARQHKIAPQTLPLSVIISDPSTLKQISNYEDIPTYENLRLHFSISPFQLVGVDSKKNRLGTPRLHIRSFASESQPDLCFADAPATAHDDISSFIEGINDGDALLDLCFANGADFMLMHKILVERKITLSVFSSWNTTGNRLGTLIAQLGIREIAKSVSCYDESADRAYLLRSLLDDFLFQSHIRQSLLLTAQDMSLNPWALGTAHDEFSEFCKKRLREAAEDYGLPTDFEARLPWPRLFEVLIRL